MSLSFEEEKRLETRFKMLYNWIRGLHHPLDVYQDTIVSDSHLGWETWYEWFRDGLNLSTERLLAQVTRPTIQEVLAVGWSEEQGVGVYFKAGISDTLELPDVAYSGMSMAGPRNGRRGIEYRKYQHVSQFRAPKFMPTPFHLKIGKENRHHYHLEFSTLWIDTSPHKELIDDKKYFTIVVIQFMELLLGKWLNAFDPEIEISKPARVWKECPYVGTLQQNAMREGWCGAGFDGSLKITHEQMKWNWKEGLQHKGILSDEGVARWKELNYQIELEQHMDRHHITKTGTKQKKTNARSKKNRDIRKKNGTWFESKGNTKEYQEDYRIWYKNGGKEIVAARKAAKAKQIEDERNGIFVAPVVPERIKTADSEEWKTLQTSSRARKAELRQERRKAKSAAARSATPTTSTVSVEEDSELSELESLSEEPTIQTPPSVTPIASVTKTRSVPRENRRERKQSVAVDYYSDDTLDERFSLESDNESEFYFSTHDVSDDDCSDSEAEERNEDQDSVSDVEDGWNENAGSDSEVEEQSRPEEIVNDEEDKEQPEDPVEISEEEQSKLDRRLREDRLLMAKRKKEDEEIVENRAREDAQKKRKPEQRTLDWSRAKIRKGSRGNPVVVD